MSLIAELIAITEELAPDAQAALLYVAKRIRAGQEAYGPLELRTDGRNWDAEMDAEAADLMVYHAFKMISRGYKK